LLLVHLLAQQAQGEAAWNDTHTTHNTAPHRPRSGSDAQHKIPKMQFPSPPPSPTPTVG